ncbi:hypothetical protein NIES4071_68400 [Calothrix sp. NIES-4071]|nr:hypothetical protein NIES4071_68400 [Calothrix sp. NIES-4071]BAZ61118.1 hypothetical protein NIES4105_68360 [Calothrix sp. NIES-4105]
MLYLILLFYILLAGLFFTRWLDFFLDDQEMSPRMRWLSSFILLIATIFWPITVPFAYLELLNFHKKNKQIITLLMNLSNTKVLDDGYLKNKFADTLFSLSNNTSLPNEDNR